jgi:hypothetical protein
MHLHTRCCVAHSGELKSQSARETQVNCVCKALQPVRDKLGLLISGVLLTAESAGGVSTARRARARPVKSSEGAGSAREGPLL